MRLLGAIPGVFSSPIPHQLGVSLAIRNLLSAADLLLDLGERAPALLVQNPHDAGPVRVGEYLQDGNYPVKIHDRSIT